MTALRLLALVVLTLLPGIARAENLVTALSSDRVAITSNFTGSQVTIFGTVERDAQTISRNGDYHLVVTLSGPPRTIVARRKDRTAGIWLNRESEKLRSVPSFLSISTTAPMPDVASVGVRARLGLGFDMLPINDPPGPLPPIRTDFDGAFIRLMQQQKLFALKEGGVEFLSPQLFRSQVDLPANVPVGWYTATVYLFSGGVLLSRTSEDFNIRKTGFEQFVTDAAHQQPVAYGFATVLIACLTGWLAGVLFRRD
ncbi:TIGR02186 family protein [Oryzibacter oryziterrae]|uniref:TIGR02186 family protein n=1 Tax=Oryzibacter oryziterrae TaxID=2766474 RepID=UPI001F375A99|nr:TIGR02186 family protein [Oryzibacter oryziterrae]